METSPSKSKRRLKQRDSLQALIVVGWSWLKSSQRVLVLCGFAPWSHDVLEYLKRSATFEQLRPTMLFQPPVMSECLDCVLSVVWCIRGHLLPSCLRPSRPIRPTSPIRANLRVARRSAPEPSSVGGRRRDVLLVSLPAFFTAARTTIDKRQAGNVQCYRTIIGHKRHLHP